MSKTRSNSKKIASRFMSIFFALCFALLCVPNLSVLAASIAPITLRPVTIQNGMTVVYLSVDSRVYRYQVSDGFGLNKMVTNVQKSGNLMIVSVSENFTNADRKAQITYFDRNNKLISGYKLQQEVKKLR